MHKATSFQTPQSRLTRAQQHALRLYAQTAPLRVDAAQRTALLHFAVKEDIKVWRKNLGLAMRFGVHPMHPEFDKVRMHLAVGWFEAMTLMAMETGQTYGRVAALEWGDLDFETHQLRNARTGWQVMSPELELHLEALPPGQADRSGVFNEVDLQVRKAWTRIFIKAGLVPAHILQVGKQDLLPRASSVDASPACPKQI